jgi:hypothetical protein
MARNFSLETLARLRRASPAGLISSPKANLDVLAVKDPKSNAICFPWAVVESKKEKGGTLKCYRQAINAASVALRMREGLMLEKYHPPGKREEIPPIIVFTTIGHLVKLWLAYCAKTPGRTRYVS